MRTNFAGDDFLFVGLHIYMVFHELALYDILRIGLLNSKKFFHLKGKENLISFLLIDKSLTIECFSGMVSCN